MALRLQFGKHKGKTIKQIMDEDDYEYLKWLLNQEFVKSDHPNLYLALKRNRESIEWATYDEEYWGVEWFDMF